MWSPWRRRDAEKVSPHVREVALSYRAALADCLTGDLVEDYYAHYRRYHGLWSHESTWLPERLFQVLDAAHGDLHEFDPSSDDPDALRSKLSAAVVEIDAVLRED